MKIMIDNAKEEEMLVAKLPESPEEENVKDEDIQKRLSMLKVRQSEVPALLNNSSDAFL